MSLESTTFLWGLFGGCLGNLLRIVNLASIKPELRPKTFHDPLYYVQFFIVAALGGFFAFLYEVSGTHLTPVLAVNIGAAAPLIAQQFLTKSPVEGHQRL